MKSAGQVRWNFFDRMRFFWSYVFAKFAVLYQVREPRWAFFLFELRYSLTNFINGFVPGILPAVVFPKYSKLETRVGTFRIRPNSQDAAIASPAFERSDIRFLLELLDQQSQSRELALLDVGANIGTFSIQAARHSRTLKVWAFE